MLYRVIVRLETERQSEAIINEIVSALEFDAASKTVVHFALAFNPGGQNVAMYDRSNSIVKGKPTP